MNRSEFKKALIALIEQCTETDAKKCGVLLVAVIALMDKNKFESEGVFCSLEDVQYMVERTLSVCRANMGRLPAGGIQS